MSPARRRPGPVLLDRREALALLGAGTALAAGCAVQPEGATCLRTPALTAGPYWVDAQLERSDLRGDTRGRSDPRPGVPLTMEVIVKAASLDGCLPVRGARVDVWHCDAMGLYSDVPGSGTGDSDFLRGYQVTDVAGRVAFTTIYPGWYAGRAVHVHAKVRLFDAWGEVSTEKSTQLFFDDAFTDAVHATAAYAGHGRRDTPNVADAIFSGTAPVVALEGDPAGAIRGRVELAIEIGDVHPR